MKSLRISGCVENSCSALGTGQHNMDGVQRDLDVPEAHRWPGATVTGDGVNFFPESPVMQAHKETIANLNACAHGMILEFQLRHGRALN